MELVLAILMGLGIFLVIPVIIGFSVIGIYLLNRKRVLKAQIAQEQIHAIEDMNHIIENGKFEQPTGTFSNEKSKEYANVK